MKSFELEYLALEPFMPSLHQKARLEVRRLTTGSVEMPKILDVGGRKSHYTVGVRGRITISDLPRETPLQRALNLGLTMQMRSQLFSRRSNVDRVVFDDMTNSHLPDEEFDLVVAIEVLEHVQEDAKFISEVHRVLKPEGSLLMTTPNGEAVTNTNPDHKRHYLRDDLFGLLSATFQVVRVEYAIPGGPFYARGLRSWSLRHPLRTVNTMLSAYISGIQAADQSVPQRAAGTNQLIAWATKQGPSQKPLRI
jgi:SAM-dependent methyltransferase